MSERCENRGAWHIRGRILPPAERNVAAGTVKVGPWRVTGSWIRRPVATVRDHFWYEVYNSRTGRVIYRNDAFGWADAHTGCNRAVDIVRHAWAMSIKSEDLT